MNAEIFDGIFHLPLSQEAYDELLSMQQDTGGVWLNPENSD